ncbi:hypothetical protein ADK64_36895 [Streptomyces sp. MMG1121]|nr:hypothetical protein ADK64_36895 [Streptomyces sp. MMG1121]
MALSPASATAILLGTATEAALVGAARCGLAGRQVPRRAYAWWGTWQAATLGGSDVERRGHSISELIQDVP